MKNALLIEQEAVSKANVILEDAKRELDHIRKQTVELVRQYDMYKAKFKSMVNSQLELLDGQSFTVNLDQLSMFETVPESIDTPIGVFSEQKETLEENPLESLQKDDIEIINLDEE
jgi:cell division initiation protein